MLPEDSPDWLPDGWIVKVNRRDSGKVDRYFTCPISGSTFRSKNEVLHYLNFEKVDGLPKQSSTSRYNVHSGQSKLTTLAQKDLALMLPEGWILEIKTQKSGLKTGSDYKCYFDPSSGRRFYSKTDVFRYIEGGITSRDKRKARTHSLDNIQISAPKHAGATARRCLSGFPTPSSEENANVAVLVVEELPSQDSGHHSSQGFGPSLFAIQEANELSEGSILIEEPRTPHIYHGSRPDTSSEGQSEQCQEMIPAKVEMARELLGYVNNEPSNLSDLIMLGKNREISATKIPSHRRHVKKLAVRRSLRKAIGREMAGHANEASHNTSRYSADIDSADKSDGVADTGMLTHTKERCQPTNMNEKKCRLEMLPHQEEKDVDNLMSANKSLMNLSKLELSSTKQEDAMHKKTPTKRNSYKAGALSRHVNKTKLLKTIKGKFEVSGSHETQSTYSSSFEVNEKRQTRSSHRGSSSEVNEKHQTRSSRGSSSQEVIMHNIRSSVRGLSSELIAKRQTRSSPLGSSSEVTAKLETRSSYRGSSSEAGAKSQTRSSRCGSSSEVTAKHETRSSYRGSSSEAGAKNQTRSSRCGSSKTNKTKLLCLPCRASKRLAAQQPDLTAMVDVSYRSLRKNLKRQAGLQDGSSNMTFITNDHAAFKTPDNAQICVVAVQDSCGEVSKEPLTVDPGMEESPEAMKTDMNKKESSFKSPFGDNWPDPCIEFAFRTLTGDIPLFEDSTTVANYFEQRMDTVESPSIKTSPDFGGQKVLIQPNIPVQLDSVDGLNATPKEVSDKQVRCRNIRIQSTGT